MSKGSLFAEFSESSGFVELGPVLRHALKKLVSHAAAAPEGNYFLFVDIDIFRIYCIVLLFSDVEYLKVFPGMAGQFRECRYRLWFRASLPYDQLFFSDEDIFILADIPEVHGAHNGHRILVVVLFVELSLKNGSFNAD